MFASSVTENNYLYLCLSCNGLTHATSYSNVKDEIDDTCFSVVQPIQDDNY